MNFDFSDEQVMLRDTVRRYLQDNYGFEARSKIISAGGFSTKVWQEFADLGLLGLTAPAQSGGSDMGAQEAMVVMEEIGRSLVVEPLAQLSLLPVSLLKQCGKHADLLAGIADGATRVGVAFIEHASRYQWHKVNAIATCVQGQWLVTANKGVVSCADLCNAFIVPAKTDQGFSLFVVDAKQSGVSVLAYPTQDGSRAGELTLQQAKASVLGELGQGQVLLQAGLNTLLAAHCAEAVGAMEVLCEMTVDYLNTRKQFATPIGSFQALRHRLVDMRLELELARGMSWKANMAVSDASLTLEQQSAVVSSAKVAVGKAMRIVGQGAVQLHGGIAVTLEFSVGHYFKRLTCLEMIAGDTLHHLAALSDV